MCVKLPPGDLNPDPCPPHPTSTYTCGMTIAPRMCGGHTHIFSSIFYWIYMNRSLPMKLRGRIYDLKINC